MYQRFRDYFMKYCDFFVLTETETKGNILARTFSPGDVLDDLVMFTVPLGQQKKNGK